MTTSKRTLGRPRLQRAGARRVTVTLDDQTLTRARKIGSGNLSLGIRRAVCVVAGLGARPDTQPGSP